MMKSNILIVLAFACCPITSVAEDFTGRMYCEVKSNKVTGIIEGKPVEYTGYQDGIQVGETLVLTYGTVTGISEYVTFKIMDETRDKQYAWYAFQRGEDEFSPSWGSDSASAQSTYSSYELSQDEIRFSDSGVQVYLSRYYKNDWQGIATFSQLLMHHTITLDCRHTRDRIEEVVERMKSWKK